jgi:hypothetical protein
MLKCKTIFITSGFEESGSPFADASDIDLNEFVNNEKISLVTHTTDARTTKTTTLLIF